MNKVEIVIAYVLLLVCISTLIVITSKSRRRGRNPLKFTLYATCIFMGLFHVEDIRCSLSISLLSLATSVWAISILCHTCKSFYALEKHLLWIAAAMTCFSFVSFRLFTEHDQPRLWIYTDGCEYSLPELLTLAMSLLLMIQGYVMSKETNKTTAFTMHIGWISAALAFIGHADKIVFVFIYVVYTIAIALCNF